MSISRHCLLFAFAFGVYLHSGGSSYASCDPSDLDCLLGELKSKRPPSATMGDRGPAAAPPSAPAPAAAPPMRAPTAAPPMRVPAARSTQSASVPLPAIQAATSAFVGPHVYPPRNYGAYGIVAFPSLPTPGTAARYIKVCEAYVATLPPASTTEIPEDRQMVTVWPVTDPNLARTLSELTHAGDRIEGCKQAVESYGFQTALTALRHSTGPLAGRGPFLLAWSPASAKGRKDVLVLVANLSDAGTDEELLLRFQQWRNDIEGNPDIFKDQWTVQRLTTAIRHWADGWGKLIFASGGG